uniref:RxLR effector candidate protein n=1 Tax=Hyaloperonospora arabidopsidis (strain Emoy2) TaxID=559515 RepID=M4BKF8_HYAAE|nr:RxLR effector candidate protein [Hyaloperonospora arabidopsidis Emoy2]BAP68953.1 RxLR effector candidate protein [Hyaloperonospora arabidopsidis Emoy2]
MTKCSLLLVPFLVAIAVSDALPARAAGTLPQSATSVQDKATESTVSGKRALQSKEDTKGAADEERALNWLQSVPEWLSTMMKKTTDWMARTWKGASFSVSGVSQKEASFSASGVSQKEASVSASGVSQKEASVSASGVSQEDLEDAKAVVVNLQSKLEKANERLTTATRDRQYWKENDQNMNWKAAGWGIYRLHLQLKWRLMQKEMYRELRKDMREAKATAAKLAKPIAEAKKKVDDINAAIQARRNTLSI